MSASRSKKWATGAIRIFSETMSATDIARMLGLEPTEAHEKGEQAKTRSSHPASWTTSVWLLASKLPSTSPVEAHIETLLAILEERTDALRQLSRSCTIEFFMGFSSVNGQGGFTLGHNLLARMAALPVDLSLDLYPPEM